MLMENKDIKALADRIYAEYSHLFPSLYPDIPLNTPMLNATLKKLKQNIDEDQLPGIMQRVELELAKRVSLSWKNYGTIAILLHYNYPEEDLVPVSLQRVIDLTRSLPNFNDTEMPDDEVINAIIYTWIGLRDEESYFEGDDNGD
jgi:FeS assembly protein IscX